MAGPVDECQARAHPIFLVYKFTCLIFVLLLVMLVIALTPFHPSFSIHTLYVPALNKHLINSSTANFSAADSLIFFNLELENNYVISLHYNPVQLTFYSEANKSMAIGNYTVPGFHQGHKKTTWRRDVVVATDSIPWQEAAMKALSSGAKAVFRVDAAVKVKFKNFFWYSSKKKMVVGGKIEVDDSGKKVGTNAVKLVKSGTAPLQRTGILVVTCLLVYLI